MTNERDDVAAQIEAAMAAAPAGQLDSARRLAHEAVRGILDLVEDSHEVVAADLRGAAQRVPGLAEPAALIDDLRRVITRASLLGVRGVSNAVEFAGDVGVAVMQRASGDVAPAAPRLPPMRSDALSGPTVMVDAALGALNGFFGSGLRERNNGLDLGMVLRLDDALLPASGPALTAGLHRAIAKRATADADATPIDVALYIHGLAATEWGFCLGAEAQWGDAASTLATRLDADFALLPIYARYNTGIPIADNGAALVACLDAIAAALTQDGAPTRLGRLVLIGHSMGGLVVRDAVGRGVATKATWIEHLHGAACLGSPHEGAPLERVVESLTGTLALVRLPGALVPARLLELRSAGIRDLARGDREPQTEGETPAAWKQRALPCAPSLRWLILAASLSTELGDLMSRRMGDGMVSIASAAAPANRTPRPDIELATVGGVSHAAIANHRAVDNEVRAWLVRCGFVARASG